MPSLWHKLFAFHFVSSDKVIVKASGGNKQQEERVIETIFRIIRMLHKFNFGIISHEYDYGPYLHL